MKLEEVSLLSDIEKFQLMEALWEDMRRKIDDAPIPQEHTDLLDERQRALDSGEDTLLDWDQVKHSLRKR